MNVCASKNTRAFTSSSVLLLKEKDDSIEAMVAFRSF
jgi:hypothetical protein